LQRLLKWGGDDRNGALNIWTKPLGVYACSVAPYPHSIEHGPWRFYRTPAQVGVNRASHKAGKWVQFLVSRSHGSPWRVNTKVGHPKNPGKGRGCLADAQQHARSVNDAADRSWRERRTSLPPGMGFRRGRHGRRSATSISNTVGLTAVQSKAPD
jgi:hypothetical protein